MRRLPGHWRASRIPRLGASDFGRRLTASVLAMAVSVGLCAAEEPRLSLLDPSDGPARKAVQASPEHPNALSLFASDFKAIVTAPAGWQSRDWRTVGLVSGVTLGLFVFDEDIQRAIQEGEEDYWSPDYEPTFMDRVSDVVKPLGDGEVVLLVAGGFYLTGRVTKDQRATRAGIEILESMVITGVFTEVLKRGINRERPSGAGIEHDWGRSSTAEPGYSFPSGHAANAFVVATVLATEYRHVPAVPYVAYGLASLVTYSRLNENRHWPSDVFAGAAIGYFVTKGIIARHEERRVNVVPTISPQGPMLTVHLRF